MLGRSYWQHRKPVTRACESEPRLTKQPRRGHAHARGVVGRLLLRLLRLPNKTYSNSQRAAEPQHDQAPPRRPAVDPVVGGLPRIRDPAPTSRRLQPEAMPDGPLHARPCGDALPERRDSEAEADHGCEASPTDPGVFHRPRDTSATRSGPTSSLSSGKFPGWLFGSLVPPVGQGPKNASQGCREVVFPLCCTPICQVALTQTVDLAVAMPGINWISRTLRISAKFVWANRDLCRR
jgi:hypothetical protein